MPMRDEGRSPEHFEALVREHQMAVFRTLTRLTGAGAQVEDLAQEVFLRLYRALPEFRGEAAISTYLYRIVVNVAQDEWKRRRRERVHLASAPVSDDGSEGEWIESFPGDGIQEHGRNPEQRMGDAEIAAAVETALESLPEIERTVLVLYHQEACSYEGIAAALGMPINTVRTHLHRGRNRLSERLRRLPRREPQMQRHAPSAAMSDGTRVESRMKGKNLKLTGLRDVPEGRL